MVTVDCVQDANARLRVEKIDLYNAVLALLEERNRLAFVKAWYGDPDRIFRRRQRETEDED